MNFNGTPSESKLNECFRRRFQQRLADYGWQHGSAAEGFGAIWEKTLEEVPVDEEAQGRLYRELINWAKSDELRTLPSDSGKTVRANHDKSGLASLDDELLSPQDYDDTCRRLTQEARAEIQQFHVLRRCRRVLSRHAHRLAYDLRNAYAKTKTLASA